MPQAGLKLKTSKQILIHIIAPVELSFLGNQVVKSQLTDRQQLVL